MTRDPPTKPRRRTYRTGGTLPELTDSYRPIPLGYDETGDPDGQIRAFAVNIINRSDRSVFIREGPEDGGQDEAEIPRFQSYTIYEDNGVNRINVRGSEGGEDLEIRTLEAHNDFGIKDKVEAFIRSVSHFFASNKQETVITGAETVINSNITGSDVAIDTTIGDVAEGVTFASNITGQDVPLNTTIGDVAAGVTFNSNITGQDVPIDTTIGDVAEGVTINSNITGQDLDLTTNIGDVAEGVTINSDITAQTVGDINTLPRVGEEKTRFASAENKSAGYIHEDFEEYISERHDWDLYSPAPFDGEIRHIWVRFTPADNESWSGDRLDTLGFALIVNDEPVSPSYLTSGWAVGEFNRTGAEAYISRNDVKHEFIFGWEPKGGKVPTFTKGDNVTVRVGTGRPRWISPDTSGSTRDFDAEVEVMVTERIGE